MAPVRPGAIPVNPDGMIASRASATSGVYGFASHVHVLRHGYLRVSELVGADTR